MLQLETPNAPLAQTKRPTSSKMGAPSGLQFAIDILKVCVWRWYWFVLALIVTCSLCEVYLLVTPPTYTRDASILIKNEQKEMNASMKFLSGNIDLNNEVFALRAPNLAEETVRRLNLDMNYMAQGRFHEECIYGTNLSIRVELPDLNDHETAEFNLDMHSDGTYVLEDIKRNGALMSSPDLTSEIGKTIKTPLGRFLVKKSDTFTPQAIKLRVFRTTIQQATNYCMGHLSVSVVDENSTIIRLRYTDVNPQRAEDALSTIIAVYNENWVKDRNRVSVATSEFIGERLGVIEKELSGVENDISSFKSANLIPASQNDVASIYVGQAQTAQANVTEINNQLYLARYVRNYLTNENNFYQLIPANQGLNNANVGNQIGEYNTMLLRRNNILQASSLSNPLVQELDGKLAELRNAIVRSVDNHIQSLNMELRTNQSVHSMSNSKIASSPQQSKYLLSVERQQKVKESLYLYLLQKREENELSQAFTAYNSRIITPPSGSNAPTSPDHGFIWLLGILAGLAIPVAGIVLYEMINNKVRGRRDLSELSIPFIGEIPFAIHHQSYAQRFQNFIKSFKKNKKEDKTLHIVVRDKSRNYINEAFRVVRTNIEFMSARGERSKVIMLSSFNPNSGKTFVESNLVTSLAIKNKHVLAIDLDMRKASLSAMVNKPKQGVSDYLSGNVDSVEDVIVKGMTHPNLDVLPVGTIPPNPTELLAESRLGELIAYAREHYDYVFLDCPPVEIVADATIVGKHSDMTLFVIRAEKLDKTLLPEIQTYYDENRLPKISIILNGTSSAFSYYGYHRYGYHRYGYGSYNSYGGYAHDKF